MDCAHVKGLLRVCERRGSLEISSGFSKRVFFSAMCGECVYRKTALERSVNMSFERVNVFWGGDEVSFLYTRF